MPPLDITYVLGTLDFDQEDGLQKSGLGSKEGGVNDTPGCWDDLTTTAMDGVGVKRHVQDVEADAAHVLVAQYTYRKGEKGEWRQYRLDTGSIQSRLYD